MVEEKVKRKKDVSTTLRDARTLVGQRHASEAIALIETLEGPDPKETQVRLALAKALMINSEYERASALLDEAERDAPSNPNVALAVLDLLRAKGEFKLARDVALDCLVEFPEDERFRKRYLDALGDLRLRKQAIAFLGGIIEDEPFNAEARQALSAQLAFSGEFDAAAEHLRILVAEHPEDKALQRYMTLLKTPGIGADREAVREQVDAAAAELDLSSMSKGDALRAADRLLRFGAPEKALEIYDHFGVLDGEDRSRDVRAARAEIAAGRFEAAHALLLRFVESMPRNEEAQILLATLEAALGNLDRYFEIAGAVLQRPNRRFLQPAMAYIANLYINNRDEEADAMLANWEPLTDHGITLEYVALLTRQNRMDDLAAYLKRRIAEGEDEPVVREKLGELEDENSEWRSKDIFFSVGTPSDETMMDPKLVERVITRTGEPLPTKQAPLLPIPLAWHVSRHKEMGYDAWAKRVRWAHRAYLFATQYVARNSDLIHYADLSPIEELRPLIDDSKPFLLAASHMGPRFNQVLGERIPNLVGVTNGYREVTQIGQIPYANRESKLAAIKMVTCMRKGYPMMMALDTPLEQLSYGKRSIPSGQGTLFGVPCSVPVPFATLSQEFDAPSYFLQSEWRENGIGFRLERLPDPEPGEGRQAWQDRWARAYLEKLEDFMRGEPDNQNLTAPIWRYLVFRGALQTLRAGEGSQGGPAE